MPSWKKLCFFCDYIPCDIGEFIDKIYNKKAVQGIGYLKETWGNMQCEMCWNVEK